MIKPHSILTLIMLLLGASAARAQESGEVPKLKARIEKLEAENAAIKKELAELKKTLTALQGSPDKLPQTAEAKLKEALRDFFDDFGKGRLRSAYASIESGLSEAHGTRCIRCVHGEAQESNAEGCF
jgi:hypothetical protein